MPVRGDPDNLVVGQTLSSSACEDLKAAIRYSSSEHYDFIAVPLAAEDGQGIGADFSPAVGSQLSLPADAWASSVVGMVSDCIDPDESDPDRRSACLMTELRWAAHLALRAVILPPPCATASSGFHSAYARVVNEALLEGMFPSREADDDVHLALRVNCDGSGWTAWNRFRSFCDHHPRLGVALELGSASNGCRDQELNRWLGEPVRFVILRPCSFLTNRQGFPVLPRRLKALLQGLFRRKVEVIIAEDYPDPASEEEGEEEDKKGDTAVDAGADAEKPSELPTIVTACASTPSPAAASAGAMLTYVARLFQSLPELNSVEKFSHSHFDTLQCPLQPLQDNLESETYEVFETDPVKYKLYEEAVFTFLQERIAAGKAAPFVVMVLGAGRGPLVAASLRAAARASTEIVVWAVEKNPNAVHALRHRKRSEPDWACVEVVASDMRNWKSTRKADCIVSELLGSFGDNELSPECLDGAQHLLAEDGVSIPQSYVSSLAPISAAALWADARGRNGGANTGMQGGDSGQLETAYVVCIHRAYYPSAGPQDCFTFRHPKRPFEATNDRTAELSFEVQEDTLVHGFAGYFDCVLYGDVRMSIHPDTYSKGMFSWFPMFFPLQVPVYLRKGQTLRSHWFRRHDDRKVWYEWAISEPAPTALQNPGGRSWAIGL
mmetsp:Transcript_44642/g.95967  ORF Transcript_44642/g.95967 Transcript_44642/m.95967 type:complete len:665 (-) Transcript_44642:96-2090(-)|eukprot:CAMPEP_0206455972 /NCGR_PEP_ID=MMETSP0324_2-20121206/22090_1 /ASSEMBLY_ACC=CAM_ASM_000836 /TAXON_ID=2866 /ORGANISM="Crypthecodinium cohnii, Strain Seligo" /LENGTH=664 /DNA_ID=CAMNT_0053926817 /DNA_START=60 /DNA_END=2054 /DNA_ORIENTATION=+